MFDANDRIGRNLGAIQARLSDRSLRWRKRERLMAQVERLSRRLDHLQRQVDATERCQVQLAKLLLAQLPPEEWDATTSPEDIIESEERSATE